MNRLSNKVAIVTGAAGGMGASIAHLFASEGAKVMATDNQKDKLQEWVDQARADGETIQWHAHDVTSAADWDKVIAATFAEYGQIDILINNAGVYPMGANSENTTIDMWNNIIAINLTGPFIGASKCIPHLKKSGKSAIVNISSIAGMVGGNGPAYSASKGGLRLLSKDMGVELAKYNIRVNSIHPGGVNTPMTAPMMSVPGMDEIVKNMCPQGRMGEAEEIALGALYLASDESSYVTGTELVIDGGMIAR